MTMARVDMFDLDDMLDRTPDISLHEMFGASL